MEAGGRLWPNSSPAFRYSSISSASMPVILAVPHAGRSYPEEIIRQMRDPQSSMLKLEDRFVDKLATKIARETGAAILIAEAPRAMIDLNRNVDDVDWGMVTGAGRKSPNSSDANRRARSGLGLVPRRLAREEIWRGPLGMDDLMGRISNIHVPYHAKLATMLERMCDRFGIATLIDLHSMPPLMRQERDSAPVEFVLGDRFGGSCDAAMTHAVEGFFHVAGRRLLRNRPYAGGYVLDRHGNPRRMMHAFQLEICRTLYLDSKFENLTSRSDALVRLLSQMVKEVAVQTCLLGAPIRDAAE